MQGGQGAAHLICAQAGGFSYFMKAHMISSGRLKVGRDGQRFEHAPLALAMNAFDDLRAWAMDQYGGVRVGVQRPGHAQPAEQKAAGTARVDAAPSLGWMSPRVHPLLVEIVARGDAGGRLHELLGVTLNVHAWILG